MDVCIIKVKIGLRQNGHADHPRWSSLAFAGGSEVVAARAIHDGWKYDHDCGHKEVRTTGDAWDSPYGMQWGCLMVSRQFCREAVAAFPLLVTQITEAEFRTFYETFHNVRMTNETISSQVIEDLRTQLALLDSLQVLPARRQTLLDRATKALDPDDKEIGVRRNQRKRWSSYKSLIGIARVIDPASM